MRRSLVIFPVVIALLTCTLQNVYGEWNDCADIYVDGDLVDTGGLPYIEDGTTYVPLRQVCEKLGAEVSWSAENREALVTDNGLSITVGEGDRYVVANGRYLYAEDGCRLKEGNLMVPVRTIARAFGAEISWNKTTGDVIIINSGKPITSGDSFYSEEDVLWLSRLIYAEAGGESLEGKIAVGNVVMNRVADDSFPDSVKDVIFDRRYGVQFTPAYSGGIYNEPSEECIAAAKMVLEGTEIAGECLYFTSAWAAPGSWAAKNREFYGQIGNQMFFI